MAVIRLRALREAPGSDSQALTELRKGDLLPSPSEGLESPVGCSCGSCRCRKLEDVLREVRELLAQAVQTTGVPLGVEEAYALLQNM